MELGREVLEAVIRYLLDRATSPQDPCGVAIHNGSHKNAMNSAVSYSAGRLEGLD